ncbi:MAG: UvrB/UvrC motif-containing protein, partial [Dehalococcoidia bacterium]|nr:UvrB/UvrC motif-containing protein [Dehalococcoidia bacterium]
IAETYRRREIQLAYNVEHGFVPQGIKKAVKDITDRVKAVAESRAPYMTRRQAMSKDEMFRVVKDLETQMKAAAKNLEFEKAAMMRDEIFELRRILAVDEKGPLSSARS